MASFGLLKKALVQEEAKGRNNNATEEDRRIAIYKARAIRHYLHYLGM
jgi:hypothetical protein